MSFSSNVANVGAWFTSEETDTAFFAARGTTTNGDWIQNSRVRMVSCEYPLSCNGEVHSGFHDGAKGFVDAAFDEGGKYYSTYARVIFTGHSLGGAIATLLANHVWLTEGSTVDPYLITFASPQVGSGLSPSQPSSISSRFELWEKGKVTYVFTLGYGVSSSVERDERYRDVVTGLPGSSVFFPYQHIHSVKRICRQQQLPQSYRSLHAISSYESVLAEEPGSVPCPPEVLDTEMSKRAVLAVNVTEWDGESNVTFLLTPAQPSRCHLPPKLETGFHCDGTNQFLVWRRLQLYLQFHPSLVLSSSRLRDSSLDRFLSPSCP